MQDVWYHFEVTVSAWYMDGNSHVAGAESCMASVWGDMSGGLEDVNIVLGDPEMCFIMVSLYVQWFLSWNMHGFAVKQFNA